MKEKKPNQLYLRLFSDVSKTSRGVAEAVQKSKTSTRTLPASEKDMTIYGEISESYFRSLRKTLNDS